MLIVALGAVVVGVVLLVVSFLTENTAWAWGCIGACAVAAIVLVIDTIRRGRAPAAAESPAEDEEQEEPHEVTSGSARPVQRSAAAAADAPTQVLDPVAAKQAPGGGGKAVPADREPDEEDVDAADALTIGGLTDEVLVVDERPRFHLASCAWLRDRPTLRLPIKEAADLGFTGCAVCRPATTLAAQSRAR